MTDTAGQSCSGGVSDIGMWCLFWLHLFVKRTADYLKSNPAVISVRCVDVFQL